MTQNSAFFNALLIVLLLFMLHNFKLLFFCIFLLIQVNIVSKSIPLPPVSICSELASFKPRPSTRAFFRYWGQTKSPGFTRYYLEKKCCKGVCFDILSNHNYMSKHIILSVSLYCWAALINMIIKQSFCVKFEQIFKTFYLKIDFHSLRNLYFKSHPKEKLQ